MNGRDTDSRLILEEALADVLGEANAVHLRGDSPLLASLGTEVLTVADALVLADAVERRAAAAGALCRLTDEDFMTSGSSVTVADLTSRIEARMRERREPSGSEAT